MTPELYLILVLGLAAMFGWLFWLSERLDKRAAQETAECYRRKWIEVMDSRQSAD
jgi:predicted negative regulator of RcsB-dependent stress response